VFDTGDMAYMDDEGYIRIDGRIRTSLFAAARTCRCSISRTCCSSIAVLSTRSSGILTRGWENGPAHSWCWSGQTLNLGRRAGADGGAQVAKQYWPERVEIVADLPKTPAGKVQKYQLRELAKVFAEPRARPAH